MIRESIAQSQQGDEQLQEVEQMISQLPPQAKQALGKAIAQGVPIREALTRIVEAVKGTQQQPQGNENATAQ